MRPGRPGALLAFLTLLLPALAGCALLGGPEAQVTNMAEGPGRWNRNNVFTVRSAEPVEVRIEARDQAGRLVQAQGLRNATVELPDGTWTISYWVDGSRRDTLEHVQVDTTPPTLEGLEAIGDADASGTYTIGVGARAVGAASLRVTDARTGATLGTSLPVRVTGLEAGLHAFVVNATDAAGNTRTVTVQVRVGEAAELPDGRFTFGVVARYTNGLLLWDLTQPERYLPVIDAQRQAGGFLGSGFGITPEHESVRAVVRDVVRDDMNTMQRALALYEWFADNLEYDDARLSSESLLLPRQVLLDGEDPSGRDCADEDGLASDCDGLVNDGPGNGVRGGICRDLAAAYVSLLRAAGVPARLVSGYVAGNVNGFHAWVEFYGGALDGQSPWIPVDVSTIDGPFREDMLLQAFGILQADYLPLRDVPVAGEIEGWSTALSVRFSWLQGQGAAPPDIRFRNHLSDGFTERGVLCINAATRARLAADTDAACGRRTYGSYIPEFVLRTERTIDYGIEVMSAQRGTNVIAEVAYPFPADIEPNDVIYQFYPSSIAFTYKANSGKVVADFNPRGA